ncbi:MAG: NFACT family protein [Firmicutes bacterium]|uniref:NFACT family protein n=1 Tax=Candidatus Alloenteromonas pullistercoris TaxID=2840785 RepID=A0A9D9DEQ1_9FIRM|nr:NFACT family protein [Candidatus Enteromonas pullistercoris]
MIKASRYKEYAKALQEALKGKRMRGIREIAPFCFYFMLPGKSGLVVKAKGEMGAYISPTSFPSVGSSQFAFSLRKRLSEAEVSSISQVGGDRILCLSLSGLNEVYHRVCYRLYLEFIPGRGNIVLTDEGDKILSALHYEERRLLLPGAAYLPPEKGFEEEDDPTPFDLAEYSASQIAKEEEMLNSSSKGLRKSLLSKAKKKEKSLERKIEALERDITQAKAHLNDGEIGDYILTNLETLSDAPSFLFEGREITIDKSKSLPHFAQSFYKSAKKAKGAIENSHRFLEQAKQELSDARKLCELAQNAPEEALKELESSYELSPSKGEKRKQRFESSLYPYRVDDGGTAYLFGRNAASNDFLSFVYDTDKDHVWMHAKLTHGAHLIIKKASPSKEELSLGCELTLLASGLQSGEVMYCPHREIRKGKEKGQVRVNSYESAYFPKIGEKAKRLFQTKKKL